MANELVRGLYWEERVVKSVNLSAGNQLLVIYKEKDGKYAMAGDWAINMGLSGLRFEKLYINSEREEISGEYPKGDGSSIEFNIPIQDLGHKDMSAMQKGIEKLGFLDWLVSEAAKELFGCYQMIKRRKAP